MSKYGERIDRELEELSKIDFVIHYRNFLNAGMLHEAYQVLEENGVIDPDKEYELLSSFQKTELMFDYLKASTHYLGKKNRKKLGKSMDKLLKTKQREWGMK